MKYGNSCSVYSFVSIDISVPMAVAKYIFVKKTVILANCDV